MDFTDQSPVYNSFSCTYVDDREVLVNVLNVKKDGESVHEISGIVKNLTEDYVRHIHECARRFMLLPICNIMKKAI
ncbi:hypothetical protein [Aneurinibacillus terranovensis]|uniref:hypothetical protein n=1 Tax=Aneurinibacillus terranovensis TaxID=278991 RepID=UPI001B7FE95F